MQDIVPKHILGVKRLLVKRVSDLKRKVQLYQKIIDNDDNNM